MAEHDQIPSGTLFDKWARCLWQLRQLLEYWVRFRRLWGGGGYGESLTSSLPQLTVPSAEGLWRGTTSTSRLITGLVLEDSSYWVFYAARDNPSVLAGLVQGTGTSLAGSLGSSNTSDFNLEGAGIRTATLSGTYVPKKSFPGTITYFSGNTESFATTYDADSTSTPNLNVVARNYGGVLCR